MKNNKENKKREFCKLISQVLKHPNCPKFLQDAILTEIVENFEKEKDADSPEWLEWAIFNGVKKDVS